MTRVLIMCNAHANLTPITTVNPTLYFLSPPSETLSSVLSGTFPVWSQTLSLLHHVHNPNWTTIISIHPKNTKPPNPFLPAIHISNPHNTENLHTKPTQISSNLHTKPSQTPANTYRRGRPQRHYLWSGQWRAMRDPRLPTISDQNPCSVQRDGEQIREMETESTCSCASIWSKENEVR